MSVSVEQHGHVAVISLARPEVRNAVDGPTAQALADAFRTFDADPELRVAVFRGPTARFVRGPISRRLPQRRARTSWRQRAMAPWGHRACFSPSR
nr:enoyl-CoA hydratase-related protein [Halioglobus japonicus]